MLIFNNSTKEVFPFNFLLRNEIIVILAALIQEMSGKMQVGVDKRSYSKETRIQMY